jgi:hypothetical protein
MNLELDDQDAHDLRTVLDDTLRDMSHEIADTDNASFRQVLRLRRDRLQRLRLQLGD